MAGLVCGGFRFSNDVEKNKSFIHLKITESAQKALDEYLQLPNYNKNGSIVISADGLEGGIKIPGLRNTPFFKFIEQKNKSNEDPASSLECVSESYQGVLSKGILNTVRLQATNDSYENTRLSVANAIAKNGKNCVKELKPSNSVVRHRPTRPTLGAPPRNPNTNLSSSHYSSQSNANSPMNGISNIAKASPNIPPRLPSIPIKKPYQQNMILLRKPIKERIIQLLAVRPMKKPELLQRLKNDGVKEFDRKKLTSVIHSAAILKDNVYHLQKHLWTEVQEDWIFISEEDRTLLKKNKASCSMIPPSRDSGASTSGGSTLTTACPPKLGCSPGSKRQSGDSYEHASKRSRLEHQVESDEPKRRRDEPGRYQPKVDSRYEQNRDASQLNGESPACTSVSPLSQSNSPLESGNKVSENASSLVVGNLNGHVSSTQNGDTSQYSNGHSNSQLPSIRQENLSNYVELFPPIHSLIERRKYKVQFKDIYDEYNKLFNELNDYKNNFAALRKKIADLVGTPKYDSERCRVVEEFERITPNYRPKKERYNFLHKVLNHLKLVVGRFDSLS